MIGVRLRAWYGGSALHLVLMVCSLALAAYAGVRLLAQEPVMAAVWFAGAALAHDLVLLPAYSALDRAAQAAAGVRGRGPDGRGPRPWLNHVRVPAVLSGLLLLVWLPLILRLPGGYREVTGMSVDVFAGRWLLATAALFGASGLLLAVRVLRAGRRRRAGGRAG
ncbi:hypothetical protein [Streptomonospora litoralis]|uniref:Uncharacterized protein n=1 Tax=Streptomonospora litoralis TaxID=2498135 RepID=A0A4P6Q584_9ACTN|nr:hypothetical protein [Streptomonospora litoralis]QBI54034.1 hypothetical protein EKD16_11245 [Streptomonospora litoralis]